ncbi:hypothetical protein ACEPAH_779 [Sanghuangporus vaninii]
MTRQFGRANTPPSGDALNALDLALKEAVLSSVSALNVTASTAAGSAASSSAAATGSEAISASASASAISAIESSVPESAWSVISSASAVSQSAASSVTPSASSAPSQEVSSVAPIPTSSVASAAPRSASSSDPALSVPKNAVAVSSESTEPAATPVPSAPASSTEKSAASLKTNIPSSPAASPAPSASAASTEKNASPKTNATSSSEATASTATTAVSAPSSSSVNSTVKLETTSSVAPVTSASTQVQPSPSSQVPSNPSNVASTQRAQASSTAATTPSNRNDQASSPNSSPQSTNAASPPQATDTSNQAQNSPSNADLRGSQPSAANSPSPQSATNLGNSLVGVSPSSTAIVHVDSTLSTPQGLTISSGGSTFVTTPAIFTSISVSSGKDGTPLATFTSVFANPTTVPQTASWIDSSFWDKKGAVAGVFTAVGLIMLASIFGTFYLCRRQRRKTGRPFAKPAQFHRFSGPPEMTQQPTTYQPVRPRRFPIDDPQRSLLAPSITSGHSNGHEDPAMMLSASRASSDAHQPGALGLTGVLANSSGGMQDYHGPFSDYHRYISTGDTRLSTPPGETIGMAVTTDFSPKESKPEQEGESGPPAAAERRSTPSPAPSSPSIYPPSLPAVPETDEDNYLFYERETKQSRPESQLPTPPPRAVINDAPDPRNPFSSPLDPVYNSTHKQTVSLPPPRIVTNQAYRPLTPPDSSAGHSPSTPQSSEPSESTKPLNVTPYSNTFLGRSVSMRTEPLPRPKRSPLRLSASGASLHQNSELP